MNRHQLLRMIAAHDGNKFLFSAKELDLAVEEHDLEGLLNNKGFFLQCGVELRKELVPDEASRMRLVEIFGFERIARFLGTERRRGF